MHVNWWELTQEKMWCVNAWEKLREKLFIVAFDYFFGLGTFLVICFNIFHKKVPIFFPEMQDDHSWTTIFIFFIHSFCFWHSEKKYTEKTKWETEQMEEKSFLETKLTCDSAARFPLQIGAKFKRFVFVKMSKKHNFASNSMEKQRDKRTKTLVRDF